MLFDQISELREKGITVFVKKEAGEGGGAAIGQGW